MSSSYHIGATQQDVERQTGLPFGNRAAQPPDLVELPWAAWAFESPPATG
jgi:hypothetical protein